MPHPLSPLSSGDGDPFDPALICLSGHVVNTWAARDAGRNEAHCSQCGAKTISACVGCGTAIRGSRIGAPSFRRPAYCRECGEPFPWTNAAIQAASEYATEVELSEMDRTQLPELIEHLVKDSSRTVIAATKMKRLMHQAGPVVTEGFRKILVDVIAETAKKMLFS